MKALFTIGAPIFSLFIFISAAAHADIKPWRAGEPRLKVATGCAKSRCGIRADFSPSKPHHHHRDRVVFGSNTHTRHCAKL